MAEWASLKANGLRRDKLAWGGQLVWQTLLGCLVARGSILEVYPFGIAFGAALLLNGQKGVSLGLIGVALGTLSLVFNDLVGTLQILLILTSLILIVPILRGKKREGAYLGIITALVCGVISYLILSLSQSNLEMGMKSVLLSLFSGALAVVFWFALRNQEALWRGEFTREQGTAWLVLLVGIISGLQGVKIGEINLVVTVLSFFILFVAERFGAGPAAGVGVMLGFLPHLQLNAQNLMEAGIYGLAGFGSGAFKKLGKLGIGIAFTGVILMLTVSLRPEAVYPQLVSSALALLLFLFFPSAPPQTNFLKSKPMPEVESTVTKVKTVAEIFEQIAYSAQAAEAEVHHSKPDIPELMNVLVERVCKTCPTIETCWTREFYKTYHFLFNLFEEVERAEELNPKDLPLEWKRHCGRLKEMVLGVQFILEHEKSLEGWRARLAANQDALSRQFQSVSQVMGHLAKELNTRHNLEQVKYSGVARRRREFLDMGVASFTKSGNAMSGDNYASLAFSPTEHAVIVSDGMGVGDSAAKLSATALSLLEQLLNTGFEPEGAIQALNSILVLRSPEESFVTIDMAILDLESNGLRLVKVGACPSYIKGIKGVRVLETSSLPAGILNHIDIPVLEEEFLPEEVLVLVTDGIQDLHKDGTDWLKSYLENQEITSSQELAQQIVSEARRSSADDMFDDGVVLIIRKKWVD
ncbi:SpoIIE family protein phosphatase [Desulfitobacterium metallireducens]|uniref:Serine phosphatase n=1 Tax=Desulfitobacterium metallireducens DSM 15288 TaxID=871968 RepID=W0E9K9_9FIRM|nr:SpoIIE family protein phosphatase [Desulfitobacterium metallireducens]AHF05731.1 serine phosphatase [Desulfitobacterium metallireducens DSM 15288]